MFLHPAQKVLPTEIAGKVSWSGPSEKFHGLGQVRSFMVWASEKKVSWFGQVKQCETHPQHLLSLLFPQLFLESSLYVI